MKIKSLLLLAMGLMPLLFAPASHAQAPRVGSEYNVYNPPQPTDAGPGKIEVSEFFAYTCSHCLDMDPLIHAWAAKQSKDVVLRRVPVVFNAQFVPAAKAFYAMETLGVLERLHADFFNAIQKDRLKFQDEKILSEWMASKGVDAAKFLEVYKSFAVQSKVQRADQMTKAHGVSGTPTLTVNGKYLINNQIEHPLQLKVADYLIGQIRAEQKSDKK